MKKTVKIILFILFVTNGISCTNAKTQEKTVVAEEKENNCKDVVRWGEIAICLPEIDKMKNIYSLPKMQKTLDEWEYEGNTVLAYYVSDDIYNQTDKIDEIIYDDYFKVYSVNNFKNVVADRNGLVKLADATTVQLRTNWNNWGKLKEESSKRNLSFDNPVLIEDYYINPDVKTILFLMKMNVGDYERIMVATMNMAVIKNRIIYFAYYKDYEGEESIKKARAKNDYLVLRFLNENQ